ncbi:MAG: hypothetical protein ABIH27_00910 [Candidatus Omnitrophota bacterium]
MINFFLMNLITGYCAYLLVYKFFQFSDLIDSLIAVFLLYFSQIIITELFLGILGALSLNNLILFNLLILSFIFYLSRDNRYMLNPLSGAGKALARFFNNKVFLFIICSITAYGLVKVFINLVNPPFGWDNLNYHFTFPVEWLKHANLDTPITINDDPGPTYYPINGSLWYLWLIFPFRSVFIADLGQLPFFILGFLSVYNISRKLDLKKELCFYAAGLFVLIPNFFKQLQVAYVDVIVGSLLLVCLNYLFSFGRKLLFRDFLLFSISLGLFIGVKTTAVPFSILLIVPFLYFCLKNIKKVGKYIPVFMILIIALGGFSYLRNFIQTGNPLFPLDFKLFGTTVLKGVMDMPTYRAHFVIQDYSLFKALFHEGLGAQTLLIIFPAVFLCLPVAWIKKRKSLNFNLVYFMLLPVLLYLVYRYIIPLANLRYLYGFLGIGMILGFYICQAIDLPKRWVNILTVFCVITSMAELAKRNELAVSVILTFLFFFLFIKLSDKIKFKVKSGFVLAAVILGLFLLSFLEKDYLKNEFPGYVKMEKYSGFWMDATRAWEWLNNNTKKDNIAYTGRPVPFPLYGTKFKNNVYYVSLNRVDPPKLHYFPDSRYVWGRDYIGLQKNLEAKGNYRSGADYSIWLNNLLRRDTGYLFIYSLHQTEELMFPLEDAWASVHPERFRLAFSNDTIHVYKIVGSR